MATLPCTRQYEWFVTAWEKQVNKTNLGNFAKILWFLRSDFKGPERSVGCVDIKRFNVVLYLCYQ